MRIYPIIAFTILILLSLSCSTSYKPAKSVELETRDKMKYAVLTTASGDGYTLHLRENNFFDLQGKEPNETHSNLYAGSWEKKGDSLFFAFHSNYHPKDLLGTGKFDMANNLIILFSTDILRHRKLVIAK